MIQRRRSNALVVALCANAVLLSAILIVLLSRGSSPQFLPMAMAQNQPPIAGGAGVFVMPCQLSQNTWGCYLLDVDAQTLCTYQFYPGDKQLRLLAARNYRWDRRLSNFNTTPAPNDVKNLIEKEKESGRVTEPNTTPANPEAPKTE